MWSTCTPRLMQIWRSFLKHNLLNTSSNNNPLVFLWPGCFYTKGKHAASLRSCRSQRDPKKKPKKAPSPELQRTALFSYAFPSRWSFKNITFSKPRPIKGHFLVYHESQRTSIYWSAAAMLPAREVAELIFWAGKVPSDWGLYGWRLSGTTRCTGRCRHQNAWWWDLPRKVGSLP